MGSAVSRTRLSSSVELIGSRCVVTRLSKKHNDIPDRRPAVHDLIRNKISLPTLIQGGLSAGEVMLTVWKMLGYIIKSENFVVWIFFSVYLSYKIKSKLQPFVNDDKYYYMHRRTVVLMLIAIIVHIFMVPANSITVCIYSMPKYDGMISNNCSLTSCHVDDAWMMDMNKLQCLLTFP